MPTSNKIKKTTEERLEDAWLGLDFDEKEMFNPIEILPMEFDGKQEYFMTYLLAQSEYFMTFANLMYGMELIPYQGVILKELWERRFPFLIGVRGLAKTSLLALHALNRAVLLPGRKIVLCGAVFRQSKMIFEHCERIWRSSPMLRDIAYAINPNSGLKKDTDIWVLNIGYSTISAIPVASGDTIRGMRANDLFVDEIHAHNREIFETVLSPFTSVSANVVDSVKSEAKKRLAKKMRVKLTEEKNELTKPNQLVISGTAYYQFNHAYEYWKKYKDIIESRGDEEKLREILKMDNLANFNWRDYSIIRIPYELTPPGLLDPAQIIRAKATSTSSSFLAEYNACFPSDSNGFFRMSLLESCTVNKTTEIIHPSCGSVLFTPMIKGNSSRKYVYGVDPAYQADNFAIIILEIHPDHRRIVYVWTINKKEQTKKIKEGKLKEHDFYYYCVNKLRELMKTFPCEAIALDSQGGGTAILEAFGHPEQGEYPVYPIIDPANPKDTDGKDGRHIIHLCQFANANWNSESNHGLKIDFETKTVLFPYFDPIELALDEITQHEYGYDTLENCIREITELKNELASIVISQTPSGRERWDTPDVKLSGGKKGRARKDRYSALVMANGIARRLSIIAENQIIRPTVYGGFATKIPSNETVGVEFSGPSWFVQKMRGVYD